MTVRGVCMIPVHGHGVHVEITGWVRGTELPFHLYMGSWTPSRVTRSTQIHLYLKAILATLNFCPHQHSDWQYPSPRAPPWQQSGKSRLLPLRPLSPNIHAPLVPRVSMTTLFMSLNVCELSKSSSHHSRSEQAGAKFMFCGSGELWLIPWETWGLCPIPTKESESQIVQPHQGYSWENYNSSLFLLFSGMRRPPSYHTTLLVCFRCCCLDRFGLVCFLF